MATDVSVVWEGPFHSGHRLARINRRLCVALAATGQVEVATEPSDAAGAESGELRLPQLGGSEPAARRPKFRVRHRYPPNLGPSDRPWVWYQPWEFGPLPRAWLDPADPPAEIWVPSSFVRDCFIQSGTDPWRLAVIPYGVDPAVYHGGAKPATLPVNRSLVFLFVGEAIPRRGLDLLLEAYGRAFGPRDDAALVVADLGPDPFGQEASLAPEVERFASHPGRPAVAYLRVPPSEAAMAALYRACHCLVYPARGDAFGLPVLEAMACGLPVIVPDTGGTREVTSEDGALLVRTRLAFRAGGAPGGLEPAASPYLVEPDCEHLVELLRRVYENRDQARAVGAAAAAATGRYAWPEVAGRALERLSELARTGAGRSRRSRREPARNLETGVAHFAAGRLEEARRAFRALLAAQPQNADAWFNLGIAEAQAGDHALAAACLIRSLQAEGQAGTYAHLGTCLVKAGDFHSAELALAAALRLDPGLEPARENLNVARELARGSPDLHRHGWYRRQLSRLGTDMPFASPEAAVRAIAHAFEGTEAVARRNKGPVLPFLLGCRRVLDIGCGTGTLLELLREHGVAGLGIDLDPARVEAAADKGLDVRLAEAVQFLADTDEEFDACYLGHLIEHLSGPDAVRLLFYCVRRLPSGGVIAVQTPNYANPLVRDNQFWLDISHVRPYPAMLLARILELLGCTVVSCQTVLDDLDLLVVGHKAVAGPHPSGGKPDGASSTPVRWP